jgi:plasmid stabilization system protein ParE
VVEIQFLPGARIDYLEAVDWYRARSHRALAGFEAAIEAALRRIADAPLQWPLCDDRHRFYILRRFPFSIVYRILPSEELLVVALPHSSRSATYWAGREVD